MNDIIRWPDYACVKVLEFQSVGSMGGATGGGRRGGTMSGRRDGLTDANVTSLSRVRY